MAASPSEVVFEECTLRLLRYHTHAVKFAELILIQ
jgi:hypothetical protein